MTTTDDPLEKRVNSVGRLLPHVDAKVVSPKDKATILPINEKGELAISGYNVQKYYWNDPEKTSAAMPVDSDNRIWMLTGDEAQMDSDGYIKITGRIKDLIIRGGENIHPLEIENCLLGHPNILEAACVGLKDPLYGEVLAAFLRGDRDNTDVKDEEVREWVRLKLCGYLVPKYIFWISDFPKTASGKIQKFKLREMGEELRKPIDGGSNALCMKQYTDCLNTSLAPVTGPFPPILLTIPTQHRSPSHILCNNILHASHIVRRLPHVINLSSLRPLCTSLNKIYCLN